MPDKPYRLKAMNYFDRKIILAVILVLICIPLSVEILYQTYNGDSDHNFDYLYRNIQQQTSFLFFRNEPVFGDEDDSDKFLSFSKPSARIALLLENLSKFNINFVSINFLIIPSRSPPRT